MDKETDKSALKKRIAKRLTQGMAEANMEQEDLAAIIHVTRGLIGHYKTARRLAPIYRIEAMERALEKPRGWLTAEEDKKNELILEKKAQLSSSYKTFPLLKPNEVSNYIKNGILPQNLKEASSMGFSKSIGSKSFGMLVIGDAMATTSNQKLLLKNGDYVIIDPDFKPQIGNLVAIRVGKENDVKIRQYQIDGSQVLFKAFDPQYPIIFMNDEIEILGVIREKCTVNLEKE